MEVKKEKHYDDTLLDGWKKEIDSKKGETGQCLSNADEHHKDDTLLEGWRKEMDSKKVKNVQHLNNARKSLRRFIKMTVDEKLSVVAKVIVEKNLDFDNVITHRSEPPWLELVLSILNSLNLEIKNSNKKMLDTWMKTNRTRIIEKVKELKSEDELCNAVNSIIKTNTEVINNGINTIGSVLESVTVNEDPNDHLLYNEALPDNIFDEIKNYDNRMGTVKINDTVKIKEELKGKKLEFKTESCHEMSINILPDFEITDYSILSSSAKPMESNKEVEEIQQEVELDVNYMSNEDCKISSTEGYQEVVVLDGNYIFDVESNLHLPYGESEIVEATVNSEEDLESYQCSDDNHSSDVDPLEEYYTPFKSTDDEELCSRDPDSLVDRIGPFADNRPICDCDIIRKMTSRTDVRYLMSLLPDMAEMNQKQKEVFKTKVVQLIDGVLNSVI